MIRVMRHTARLVKFSMKYFGQICPNRWSVVGRRAGLPGCLFDSEGISNVADLAAADCDCMIAPVLILDFSAFFGGDCTHGRISSVV